MSRQTNVLIKVILYLVFTPLLFVFLVLIAECALLFNLI